MDLEGEPGSVAGGRQDLEHLSQQQLPLWVAELEAEGEGRERGGYIRVAYYIQ